MRATPLRAREPGLVSLVAPALGEGPLSVLRVDGEEALGRGHRLEITLTIDASIDAEAAVGAPARLLVGGRALGGVIADIESRDLRPGGLREVALTLAGRASLLSRGRASRSFSRLSIPDIIEAVVAASGVDVQVESRLLDAYPPRAAVVQHRESDLDFILRLAEREGICVSALDDGDRASLTLTDHNASLPSEGDLLASGVRSKRSIPPRRITLSSFDPLRPELPLRASAIVSEPGAGEVEIHDLPFSTPEEGERAAAREAERLRAGATSIQGTSKVPVAPGRRAIAGGREVVVVSVRHALSEDGSWSSLFFAVPASLPFRPERRTKAPTVHGLQGGRLAGWDRARDDQPMIDDVERASSRPMAAAEGALGAEGAEILWGCVDGDPERPIVTAVLAQGPMADARRAVLRGPRGAFFEIGSLPAPRLGDTQGTLDGRVPEIAHHASGETQTYSEGTGTTDTWMRFGVPHYAGSSTSGWSYLRIGEAAVDADAISASDGSTFTESAKKCASLEVNAYTSKGLAGVFDFTDKNRTVITKGDSEEIVKGLSRTAVYGTNGAVQYLLNVGENLVTENTGGPSFNYSAGTSLDIFGGLKVGANVGSKVEASLGGNFNFDLGFLFNATAGYRLDYIHADSFEVRKGEELSSASTIDKRASNKIQLSIHPGGDAVPNETKLAALVAVAATLGIAAAADATEHFSDEDGYTGIATGLLGLAMFATFAAMRARSTESELADGSTMMSLETNPTSDESKAAIRADDWLFLMSPDYAVLGKNNDYATTPSVSALQMTETGTAIVLEEGGKLRLQTAETGNTVLGTISMVKGAITIQAESVVIQGPSGGAMAAPGVTIKGPVTIEDKLTVKAGGLEVTGDTKITGKFGAGSTGAELTAD